jgi:protein TonB
MFESALLSGESVARRSFWVTLAIAFHASAVLAALGASLWRDEDLPAPEQPITLVTFAPAPPPAGVPSGRSHRSEAAAPAHAAALVPRDIPAAIPNPPAIPQSTGTTLDIDDTAGAAYGEPDGLEGVTGDTPGALDTGAGSGPGDRPLVIGGDVRPPLLLERIDPRYPEVAGKAHVEGVVILQAIIGIDGRVEQIALVKSASPMLDDEAIRAVRGWRYRPATLNGRPVRVYLTVTADFRLR